MGWLGPSWAAAALQPRLPCRQPRSRPEFSPSGRSGKFDPIPFYPASASVYDRREAWFVDGYINRWYLNPLTGRNYPEELIQQYHMNMDLVRPGDLDEVAAPTDFLGVNYYTRAIVRNTSVPEEKNLPPTLFAGDEKTKMGWEVYPQGLYELLCRLHFEYNFPAYYVTKNGAATDDQPDLNGQVHNPARISYLERHFTQAARAIQACVPLRGYFVWSLLDNFEWAEGYTKRFGLINVVRYPAGRYRKLGHRSIAGDGLRQSEIRESLPQKCRQ